jgi:hypothetical protein
MLLIGAGCASTIVLYVTVPSRFTIVVAIIACAMLLLTLVRGFALAQFLTLERDSCTIPSGFLRGTPRVIEYGQIREIREYFLPFNVSVLRISTNGAPAEIVSALLKDAPTYASLKTFFTNRQWSPPVGPA